MASQLCLMPDTRLNELLFLGVPVKGERQVTGQRKRNEDTLEAALKSFEISK
jgi:hypothetical protein